MIQVSIFRNQNGDIYGFKADDHGDTMVCAAVSALALNTVNSIEAFCDERFTCEYDDKGGFLLFTLPDVESGKFVQDVNLLLNSFALGISGIAQEYAQHIKVNDVKFEQK